MDKYNEDDRCAQEMGYDNYYDYCQKQDEEREQKEYYEAIEEKQWNDYNEKIRLEFEQASFLFYKILATATNCG